MQRNNRSINRANAEKHEALIEKLFKHQIQDSIEASKIYSADSFSDDSEINAEEKADQLVWSCTSDQAAIKAFKNYKGKKIAVLNFASYKNPGGGYLNGAMAQEEALCGVSDLYPIITSFTDYYAWNKQHLNDNLYTDRAIYTPDVLWGTSTRPSAKTDVITCAAPNKSAARGKAKGMANDAMIERMKFVKKIAEDQQVDVLILGAWGADVFGFNAKEVAKMWQEAFDTPTSISTVIYAVIPGRKNKDVVADFKDIFV